MKNKYSLLWHDDKKQWELLCDGDTLFFVPDKHGSWLLDKLNRLQTLERVAEVAQRHAYAAGSFAHAINEVL